MKEPQFPNNKIQKYDWFARSRGRFEDNEELQVRPDATEEEKERMRNDFQKLGELFQDIPVVWIIDGAPNVSLRQDEFIGLHKDIDISFERDELETLEKELMKRGYAFFWSYRQDGDKVMQHVTADDYKEDVPKKKRIIAAIDERGTILSDVPLPNIEVHIVKRDSSGIPLGIYDGKLPERWLKPVEVGFNGVQLNMSHPARVAYYKLYSTFRAPYHQNDLDELVKTGALSNKDVDDIEKVVNEEFGDSKDERITVFIERLARLREMVSSNTQE